MCWLCKDTVKASGALWPGARCGGASWVDSRQTGKRLRVTDQATKLLDPAYYREGTTKPDRAHRAATHMLQTSGT